MDTVAERRQVFGAQVRTYRLLRGWELDDLAVRIRVTRSSMSRIELGQQNLGIDLMIAIGRALEVPLPLLVNDASTSGTVPGPLIDRKAVTRCVRKSQETIADLQALVGDLEALVSA